MNRRCILLVSGLLWALYSDGMAASMSGHPTIGGYVQIWWTIYEELENGKREPVTGDQVQQEVSGFSIRRARVFIQDRVWNDRIVYRVEGQFERSAQLTDCYVRVRIGDRLDLYLGQIKIPSTYEALTSTAGLDFIVRATISRTITDWSLSRSAYETAPFTGNRSTLRDVGVALKGQRRNNTVRCFAMVGNGLGANLFIGGKEHQEFVYTNGFGDLFYGVRVEIDPLHWIALGGHYSLNRHENGWRGPKKEVFDLHRRSASVDMLLHLPYSMRVRGLYAGGFIDDDFNRDGKTDYEYSGYEAKVMGWIVRDILEAGLRFDRYDALFDESTDHITQDHWTIGVTYRVRDRIRVQLNYTWKETRERAQVDPRSNILLANIQYAF